MHTNNIWQLVKNIHVSLKLWTIKKEELLDQDKIKMVLEEGITDLEEIIMVTFKAMLAT